MENKKKFFTNIWFLFALVAAFLVFIFFGFFNDTKIYYERNNDITEAVEEVKKPEPPPLDKADYDRRINILANHKPAPVKYKTDPKTGEQVIIENPTPSPLLWPVQTLYPNRGAILPFKRVVAYYGNLLSKAMGVLGEYPEDQMLSKLEAEIKNWEAADPETGVVPALHYIAVTAQLSSGQDGKHRLRMPDSEIDKVLAMAERIPARSAGEDAIVFLDIQVGFSTLEQELPRLEKYFKMPNVHLGIDAEFSMKGTIPPGKVVGTFDAKDINYAIDYLSKIVKDNNLTPKILVIHRYTQKMITNYQNIKITPEVQVVMHMDGWGGKAKKINTYKQFIYKEPVEFAGFKLFYKADVRTPGTTIMTPEDLLKLEPQPIYIQYQ